MSQAEKALPAPVEQVAAPIQILTEEISEHIKSALASIQRHTGFGSITLMVVNGRIKEVEFRATKRYA